MGEEYGFTGLVGRVELRYEEAAGELPASLIVKLPMATGETVSGWRARQERDPALMRRYYERCVREHRFYREIQVMFAPRLYYSAADEAQQRVVLLLEDLSGGRQGDVLEGCSIEDARLVIDQWRPSTRGGGGTRALASGFPVSGRILGAPAAVRRAGRPSSRRCGDRLPPGISDVVEGLRRGSAMSPVRCMRDRRR